MISWIQSITQKHYKWLFTIMLGVIIVAFVFTIGASPGIGKKKARVGKEYYGYDLNSQEVLQELFRSANISNLFDTGRNLTNTALAERLALTRPAVLALADDLQISEPTEYELAEYIKGKSIFKTPSGKFDAMKYENFLELIERDPNLTQDRVRETLAEDFRMEKVFNIMNGPGFVLPYEAQLSLERQNTLWSLEVAELDLSNINTPVRVTEEELSDYYQTAKFGYKIPDQVRISYALFPSNRYVQAVGNADEATLKDFYDTHIGMFIEKGAQVAQPFEAIKGRVREAHRSYMAKRMADEAANDFAYALYEGNVKKGSQEFLELLHNYSLTLVDLPAFNKGSVPKNSILPKSVLSQASTLSEDRYYSDAVATDDGVVIVFLNEVIPSRFPELEAIRNELEGKLMNDQNLKLLESRSRILARTLSKAAQNGDFSAVARREGLSVKAFDDIKLSSPPKDLNNVLLQDVLLLGEGEVSDGMITDDKSTFVYVKKRTAGTVETMQDEFKNVLGSLRNLTAAASTQAVIQELIDDQLDVIPGEE